MRLSEIDYQDAGLSLQRAFVNARKGNRNVPRELREPLSILWGGRDVVTGDVFPIPSTGGVVIERLDGHQELKQGVDIGITRGSILVPGFAPQSLLRTWFDESLPDRVRYEYVADDGLLLVSNIYTMQRGGDVVIERWTGNAGMCVEEIGPYERIYRCSTGPRPLPTFDDLVFRLTIVPQPELQE